MRRAPGALLGLGLLGLAGLVGLHYAGQPVLPSYLASWLFVLALPAGALPLVLAHDLLCRPETATVAALRALLPLMAVAILMAIPVALGRAGLYPEMATANPFAATWMRPGLVLLRGALTLALWAGFAALVLRPPDRAGAPRRRGLAGLGLVLHLVLGTLAVGDWVGAIDPALNASSFGLIVLVAQAGAALAAACLIVAARGEGSTANLRLVLLALLGAWLFLHVTQYLVVWSANLPDEVPWYLSRDSGLGGAAEALAGLVLLVALGTLPWRRSGTGPVAVTAALIVLLHLMEMFWLIVPAARGQFSLRFADLTAALGVVGLAAGCLALLARGPAGQGAALGRP